MSRRPPNPAAERAAKNQQTIKSLLKLEPNKVCADCKRNKHPRWASWNLGVFICIRCSGVHRGMGTHISRVKSVDLDSWTDEQLQSILSWGNARANKYWEAKLAQGHVPSESKIENFIRTKYELKRWVMDGPMPDPASLDVDGDDDIPLSIVKEKQTIDRKESIRKSSVGQSSAPGGRARGTAPAGEAAAAAHAPVIDLMGGSIGVAPPPRASTAGPTATRVPPKSDPAPPKATNSTKDSLLGLDFLGSQPAAPPRPSSTTGASTSGGAASRPDLKQSILSLYATAPRTQPPAQSAAGGGGGFGSMHSPTLSQSSNSGGFVDAFSSLSFSSVPAAAASPKPHDAFSGLSGLGGNSSTRAAAPAAASSSSSAFAGLGGGGFFDTKPAAASPPKPAAPSSSSGFGGFGGFGAFASPSPPPASAAAPPPASSSNAFGDLFDFGASSSTTPTAAAAATTMSSASIPLPGASATSSSNSVFNLSSPAHHPAPPAQPAAPKTSPLAAVGTNWSNADVWGSNDAWGSSNTTATAASAATNTATPAAASLRSPAAPAAASDFGWGSASGSMGGSFASQSIVPGASGGFAAQSIVPGASGGFAPAPKVAADEEFGGWTSSTATGTSGSGNGNAKPASGFGANEDLFSNVWG